MRGFGKAVQGLIKILLALGIPKWAIAGAGGLLLLWAVPMLVDSMEKDRGRRVLHLARLEDESVRQKADAEALATAGEDLQQLLLVTREAIRGGRRALAEEGLVKLRAAGLKRQELFRLEDQLYGALPKHPVAVEIRAQKLLDAGRSEDAERLLTRALERWPDEEALAEMLAASDEAGLTT